MYLVHDVCVGAVSLMVCSLESRTEVRTLCADGTSDLSKCPDESDENKGGSSSSSSSIRNGRVGVALSLSLFTFREIERERGKDWGIKKEMNGSTTQSNSETAVYLTFFYLDYTRQDCPHEVPT